MKQKTKLITNLQTVIISTLAELICKKEKTEYTKAYLKGLITSEELILNSKMKDAYLQCI